MEYYRALKSVGADVTFYRYPEDGHALGKVASGHDWIVKQLNWVLEKIGA